MSGKYILKYSEEYYPEQVGGDVNEFLPYSL
jgi:hypothetical protein